MDNKKYEVLQQVIGQRFTGEEMEQVMVLVDGLLDEVYEDGRGDAEEEAEGIPHLDKETSDFLLDLDIETDELGKLITLFYEEKEASWSDGYATAVDQLEAAEFKVEREG